MRSSNVIRLSNSYPAGGRLNGPREDAAVVGSFERRLLVDEPFEIHARPG